MNGRERVTTFLRGGGVDRLPLMPITMMFAADRIGRRYGEYARDHRVLVEGQIRTAEEFDFDYVSAISDPAREAADCGAVIQYFDDQPPAIDETKALLADKSALAKLKVPDCSAGRMGDRLRGVALLRERTAGAKLIEGWVEGPCAEAADLRGINQIMLDFHDDPAFVRDLFAFAVEMGIAFAKAQVEAGADIIGIGDAAASMIGPRLYSEFTFPCEKKLVDAIHSMGALTRMHICGNTKHSLEGIGKLGCSIVDLDYHVPVAMARGKMGPQQALLGNLDPVRTVRNGTAESILEALRQCHAEAGARYVVGAGCEIPRDTPLENVKALTVYARSNKP